MTHSFLSSFFFICFFIYSFCSFVYLFIHPFCSFIHLFIHSFHSFIHTSRKQSNCLKNNKMHGCEITLILTAIMPMVASAPLYTLTTVNDASYLESSSEAASSENASSETASSETTSNEAASSEAPSNKAASSKAPSNEAASSEAPSNKAASSEAPSNEVTSSEATSINRNVTNVWYLNQLDRILHDKPLKQSTINILYIVGMVFGVMLVIICNCYDNGRSKKLRMFSGDDEFV